MRFPTMWHLTSVDSVEPPFSLETPNDVRSIA